MVLMMVLCSGNTDIESTSSLLEGASPIGRPEGRYLTLPEGGEVAHSPVTPNPAFSVQSEA